MSFYKPYSLIGSSAYRIISAFIAGASDNEKISLMKASNRQ
jgi:hypothetical protein